MAGKSTWTCRRSTYTSFFKKGLQNESGKRPQIWAVKFVRGLSVDTVCGPDLRPFSGRKKGDAPFYRADGWQACPGLGLSSEACLVTDRGQSRTARAGTQWQGRLRIPSFAGITSFVHLWLAIDVQVNGRRGLHEFRANPGEPVLDRVLVPTSTGAVTCEPDAGTVAMHSPF